jgi:Cu/Ag efflux protein CusF
MISAHSPVFLMCQAGPLHQRTLKVHDERQVTKTNRFPPHLRNPADFSFGWLRARYSLTMIRFLAACSLLLLLCACSKPENKTELKTYSLHGEVLRLDPQGHIAAIKHEQIGDWMGAMTMEFPIKNPEEFARLREGEMIHATVFVEGMNYWVADIKEDAKTPADSKPPAPRK